MSREIKFRAWDSTGNRMINAPSIKPLGILGLYECRAYSAVGDEVTLPLMQYTGLKDKNGVEIYEGDILATPHFKDAAGRTHKLKHFVKWSDKYLGWFLMNCNSMDENDGSIQMFVTTNNTDEFEVIGNIYENPELVEQPK